MTINAQIIKALAPLGFPIAPDIYTGTEAVYITFNYDLLPAEFADNCPSYWRALVQVHLFAPLSTNLVGQRWKVVSALSSAGFTWPEVVDATDQDAQHFVYETEIMTDERMAIS